MGLKVAFLAALIVLTHSAAGEWSVCSPDRNLALRLFCQDGHIGYRVEQKTANEQALTLIEDSPLGLIRRDADFNTGMSFLSESTLRTISDTYSLVSGKQSRIQVNTCEKVFTFSNKHGAQLQVVVRMSADGAAFRYRFPTKSDRFYVVTGETTGFNLPADGFAWMMPYAPVDIWAPAYENDWKNKIAIGTPSPETVGWAMPALFNTAGHWILITESDASGDFFTVHFEQDCKDGLYRVRLPESEETYGIAPQEATSELPWTTPWRVIIIGKDLGTVVSSTLVTDLARPSVLSGTSWIKPGRVSWSWWSEPSSPNNYDQLINFVDLSSELGWEYSLIDLGWHELKEGKGIPELADYANSKNVGLILWYNSGGKHNQVDGGPRNLMCDPAERAAEMEKISSWGVKGVKVDFMQSDKQYVMNLYEDILKDALKYRLVVNFHGCTIPRGWNRTYPHLLTMEAVRGAEQYWDQTFAENAPMFHTIYTYTRNAIGPMDYTPVILNDPPDKKTHQTTNAHELALSVAFESGLLHFVDTPVSYLQQPSYVREFLKIVPAAWDETRYISGVPGETAILARRKGENWFVAGLNGTKQPITTEINMHFLDNGTYEASIIKDSVHPRQFDQVTKLIDNSDVLSVSMAPRGGFVGVVKQLIHTESSSETE